jgi:hypothetical protein
MLSERSNTVQSFLAKHAENRTVLSNLLDISCAINQLVSFCFFRRLGQFSAGIPRKTPIEIP